MFYGMISSEGLENPLVLNSFNPSRVVIDYQPKSTGSSYWHRYLLQIEDEKIDSVVNQFRNLMKHGWYSIFWNDKTVYVVFKDKVFKLEKEKVWKSEEYKNVRRYGIEHGVQEEYLDFNERFKYYNKQI